MHQRTPQILVEHFIEHALVAFSDNEATFTPDVGLEGDRESFRNIWEDINAFRFKYEFANVLSCASYLFGNLCHFTNTHHVPLTWSLLCQPDE